MLPALATVAVPILGESKALGQSILGSSATASSFGPWLRLVASSPSAWLVLLTFFAFWRLLRGRRGAALGVLAVWLLLALLPIGDWALGSLEAYDPKAALPARVDGIVVLGGGENPALSVRHDAAVVDGSEGRLITAASLALRYPKARLIFSGGNTPLMSKAPITEAEVARRVLTGLGVGGERVQYESGSADTHENAVKSYVLAKPQKGETWLLVTSAWHMPRALLTFRRQGWPIEPYPSDWQADAADEHPLLGLGATLAKLDRAAHEYLGLLVYFIKGYVTRLTLAGS